MNDNVLGLRKNIEELTAHIEQNKDSVGVMGEHLKNVQQELSYTESRVEANKKEIETENHLKQLADRECGRVKKDVDKLTKERLELQVSGREAIQKPCKLMYGIWDGRRRLRVRAGSSLCGQLQVAPDPWHVQSLVLLGRWLKRAAITHKQAHVANISVECCAKGPIAFAVCALIVMR